MTTVFTQERFTEAMRAVVAEKGEDYTYPEEERAPQGACRYRNDKGEPLCIIGYALHRLGVDLSLATEGVDASSLLRALSPGAFGAAWPAGAAQEVQDRGGTWGEALAVYEEMLT